MLDVVLKLSQAGRGYDISSSRRVGVAALLNARNRDPARPERDGPECAALVEGYAGDGLKLDTEDG